MARSFRNSRFRNGRGGQMGEDVNPQAYIVNLADCMLVLACGFMVALVSAFNLNISSYEEVTADDLQEVESQNFDEDSMGSGSSFVEAGTAYYDPETGTYYIREEVSDDGQTASSAADSSASSSSTSSSSAPSSSEDAIRNSKANGAD